MKRLTKEKVNINRVELQIIDGYPTGNVYVGLTSEEYHQLEEDLDKLERYEDTEEKVNVNLNILFEALKNGVWYIDEDEILFSKNVSIYYDDLLETYRLIIENSIYLRIIDYQDTWALERKELL